MTSFYRNVFWFAKGMKEYSRSGFRSACRSFNLPDLDVDCTGKVFMITGATGTLGRVVAIQLAQRGGTVHLVCRDEEKAQDLKRTITDITEDENSVVAHLVDMSRPQEVLNFAKKFKEKYGILHVLVLVTCGSLLMQRLDPVDLQFECMFPFNGLAAFTQTKRQQAVLVEHYAETYPGIHFSAMHPGWVEPQGVKDAVPKLLRKVSIRCRSVEEAADTILWLAISRAALKHSSGMFFQDRKTTCPHIPFGKTKTSLDDEKFFMRNLEEFVNKLGLS
ncbi:hypothetical protein HPB50_009119 [Hyalomma asiaticum]|uniref:Uncharacterized protein n=1 Tax=Hyalomma asiaticum TaxID=266040 RepID=A0ACB7TGY2_HYAAI|nr:hypothetical protein HPB50_009119 [Hyalomma asiaticum]